MQGEHTMDEPEAGPRRGFSAIGLPLRLAAAAGLIAALALSVRPPGPAPLVQTLQPVAPRPALLAIAPLRLAEPGIDTVRVEPGRIDAKTGLREDGLGRGSFAAVEAAMVRFAVTRGGGAERGPGLFVLLARRAGRPIGGDAPLSVLRTGGHGVVATRFGVAETMEATLGGASPRTCTGFVATRSGLRIDGFLCAPLGKAPEPRALACTIDALDLDDPSDPAGTAAFRGARSRTECDRPATLASDPAGRTGSISRRRGNARY